MLTRSVLSGLYLCYCWQAIEGTYVDKKCPQWVVLVLLLTGDWGDLCWQEASSVGCTCVTVDRWLRGLMLTRSVLSGLYLCYCWQVIEGTYVDKKRPQWVVLVLLLTGDWGDLCWQEASSVGCTCVTVDRRLRGLMLTRSVLSGLYLCYCWQAIEGTYVDKKCPQWVVLVLLLTGDWGDLCWQEASSVGCTCVTVDRRLRGLMLTRSVLSGLYLCYCWQVIEGTYVDKKRPRWVVLVLLLTGDWGDLCWQEVSSVGCTCVTVDRRLRGLMLTRSVLGGLYLCYCWQAIEGTYVDKKCPFTGNVSIRGRVLSGVVVKMKMQRTIVIRRDYLHYIRKYQRFEKRHKNMSVHLSPCFR